MEKKLKQEEVKAIVDASRVSCMQMGIPSYFEGPMGKVDNPAFRSCMNKKISDGLRHAKMGHMDQWMKKTSKMIQSQDDVTGLFYKLGAISSSVRKGETEQGFTPDVTKASAEITPPTKGEKSGWKVWAAVITVIVLIGILIFFLVRKKKAQVTE